MLKFIHAAALAATLSLVPAASLSSAPIGAEVRPAAIAGATAPLAAQAAAPALLSEFGLETAQARAGDSGLAPGQTARDFQAWVSRSPANLEELAAFRDYLAAQGLQSVVPIWQLTRTSSSWRACGAQPFEVPPVEKWGRIVKTLRFVRDDVVPRVGDVEPLSAYRNEALNTCSNGAPQSAHRQFFALDLTPVNTAVERGAMIRSICAAHARAGDAYDAGLGFYTGRRFHVDSSGFRKWGPNGKGTTSPCLAQA